MSQEGVRGRGGEQGSISGRQFAWMLVAIVTATGSAFLPTQLIRLSGQDSWIAIWLAWAAEILLATLYAWMGRRFPGETMVQYAATSLGRWIGRPLAFQYPLYFFLTAAMLLRSNAHLVTALFLPGTPEVVIASVIAAVASFGAVSGLEVLGRVAEVLVPLFAVGISMVMLLAVPRLNPALLRPVLEQGWGRPLAGVPLALGFLGICIVMGMFQAYQRKPEQALPAKAFAATVGSLILTSATLSVIALLGPDVAGATLFPQLAISREISIADFLERLDVVWMMIHVGAGFLAIGVLLWAAALGTAQTFGLPQYRHLVLPLAVLAVPLAMRFFRNNALLLTFAGMIYPLITIGVGVGLHLAMALVTVLRSPKAQAGAPR